MITELYRKYRPKTWDEIVGQDETVEQLKYSVENNSLEHCLLFTGPSGTGKTTICRLLSKEINCHPDDFHEYNAADSRGIDRIKEINVMMDLFPMCGDVKIYLLDEAAELTTFAQKALLKSMEDTPDYCYFMLATTDNKKVIPTLRNRCAKFEIKSLNYKNLKKLLEEVALKEKCDTLDESVVDKIIDVSNGSARESLVFLGQVLKLNTKEKQLKALDGYLSDTQGGVYELSKALMSGANWTTVSRLVKLIDQSTVEGVRRYLLKCSEAELLRSGNVQRANKIFEEFKSEFYSSGYAGFVNACFKLSYGGK